MPYLVTGSSPHRRAQRALIGACRYSADTPDRRSRPVLVLLSSMPATAMGHDRDHEAHSPTIYGHRGAAGYRPEHTVGSYRFAARLGDDYFEPGSVPTQLTTCSSRATSRLSRGID